MCADINNIMDFSSFSHGQVQSKQWLCETLEPYIPKQSKVAILGSWYNVLGLMMLTRQHKQYQEILGIDKDAEAIRTAEKICNAWTFGDTKKIRNIKADANYFSFLKYNIIINCSPEHMEKQLWFDNINSGSLVCLQTSNLDYTDEVWKITNPIYTLEEFKNKYPLSHIIVSDTLDIEYNDWGYKRFMLIGTK